MSKKYCCSHNKQKAQCRECGGSALCIHDKQKSKCRECGGSAYCIHDKEKSKCRECGGSGICIHGRLKAQCRECGGSALCIHDKRKTRCIDCLTFQQALDKGLVCVICGDVKAKNVCPECLKICGISEKQRIECVVRAAMKIMVSEYMEKSPYLGAYPPTYLPTYLPIYLPTYLSTYVLTHLPTYLPTYLPRWQIMQYVYQWFMLQKQQGSLP